MKIRCYERDKDHKLTWFTTEVDERAINAIMFNNFEEIEDGNPKNPKEERQGYRGSGRVLQEAEEGV
jgi:hypothetical protein